MVSRLLWASIAGILFAQAYLHSAPFALAGAVALGLALRPPFDRNWRRQIARVFIVQQIWIALHGWGFLHYGWRLYVATLFYFALSGALLSILVIGFARRPRVGPLRVAAAWMTVEALHQVGSFGFPLFLGGTQIEMPWRTSMGVIGAVGLSGLIIGLGVAATRARMSALRWAAALVVFSLLGLWQPGIEEVGESQDVAIVQGGVPSWFYQIVDDSEAAAYLVEDHYFGLAEEAFVGGPDLVLLPEAALHHAIAQTGDYSVDPLFRASDNPENATTQLLTGAYRETWVGDDLRLYNSALLLDASDSRHLIAVVDKRLLAPVVESPFTPGTGDGLVEARAMTIGVLICFESIYPRMGRQVAESASVVAILTNDAGFVRAPVSLTHARQGWSRAIELGRPIVRSAQAGISFIVDHRGQIQAQLDFFEQGVLRGTVQPTTGWTWFTLFGFMLAPVAGLLLCLFIVLGDRRFGKPAAVEPAEEAKDEGVADKETGVP